jgi:hypothetical protein
MEESTLQKLKWVPITIKSFYGGFAPQKLLIVSRLFREEVTRVPLRSTQSIQI